MTLSTGTGGVGGGSTGGRGYELDLDLTPTGFAASKGAKLGLLCRSVGSAEATLRNVRFCSAVLIILSAEASIVRSNLSLARLILGHRR